LGVGVVLHPVWPQAKDTIINRKH